MKLTNTPSVKRKSGMTLLELTVVILVLLTLISILFVGARAWKKSADRAGCIMNIRNVQQATRGYLNTHPGTTLPTAAKIYSDDGTAYLKTPVCPAAGTYTYTPPATAEPAPGTIFLACSKATSDEHAPTSSTDW